MTAGLVVSSQHSDCILLKPLICNRGARAAWLKKLTTVQITVVGKDYNATYSNFTGCWRRSYA